MLLLLLLLVAVVFLLLSRVVSEGRPGGAGAAPERPERPRSDPNGALLFLRRPEERRRGCGMEASGQSRVGALYSNDTPRERHA